NSRHTILTDTTENDIGIRDKRYGKLCELKEKLDPVKLAAVLAEGADVDLPALKNISHGGGATLNNGELSRKFITGPVVESKIINTRGNTDRPLEGLGPSDRNRGTLSNITNRRVNNVNT
ncbi:14044_t:CDS:2, partial [Racocetra fulgida]